MFTTVSVEEAVGTTLAHDITEIRKGKFKGPAFKKGYIIKKKDILHLKRLGKESLFVLRIEPDEMHENEAAYALSRALSGRGVDFDGEPKEGKIDLIAKYKGLLKVKVETLKEFNIIGDIICATRHNNTLVEKGMHIAGTRAIPLVVKREIVDKAVNLCRRVNGIIEVLPLKKVKAGLIITGNEVYHKRVKDEFEPVIRKKVYEIGSEVVDVRFVPDRREVIKAMIKELSRRKCNLIVITGGMSVDPDDVTRLAVMDAGADEITYGSPVLPGAMFMIAYINKMPVIGVPACGMFHKITIFDLILPRILAGEKVGRAEVAELGHGGLCLNCKKCRYPVCPFGKGS